MMGLAVHRMGIGPAATAGAPLDDYTSGLICCYGTIQLLSSYTDPLLRVSRSSDSAEQDIGQSAGVLDTTALTSFVGANNGVVEDMYDQFGANDTAKLGTNAIVSSGSVNLVGSLPAVDIATGVNGFTGLPAIGASVSRTMFMRLRARSGSATVLLASSSANYYAYTYQPGSSSTNLAGGVSFSSAFIDGAAAPSTRSDIYNELLNSDSTAAMKLTTNVIWPVPRIVGYPLSLSNNLDLICFALYSGLLSDADIAAVSAALLGAP